MIKRRVSQKPREVCQGTNPLKNIFIWMPSGTSKHYKTHLSSDICSSSVFQVCQPGPASSHYPLSHQSLYTPLLLKPSIGLPVTQWLRICLPMQGTRVRLVWEDPTCRGATKPVSHNYWACASGACAAQPERPWQWEARAPRWRVVPARRNWRKPSHRNKDPTQPKINKFIKKKKPSIYSSFADLLTPLLWFLSTIPFSFFPSLSFFVLLQQPSWSFPSLVSVPHLSNWLTQYWQSNYTEAHSAQKIFIGSPLTIPLQLTPKVSRYWGSLWSEPDLPFQIYFPVFLFIQAKL